MKRIVIFTQNRNFLGAQIVLIPLIKRIKREFPETKIVLFSRNSLTFELLNLSGLVDEVVLEKNKYQTTRAYWTTNADLSISLRKGSVFTTLLMALLNRKTKIGYSSALSSLLLTKTVPYDTQIYRAENYLQLIENNYHDDAVRKKNSFHTSDNIYIIPGAGGEHKIWPIESYLRLAQLVVGKSPGKAVIFILGEKERKYKKIIEKAGFESLFNASFKELFVKINSSSLVIANDCGPAHIAQISYCRYIILYSDEKNDADRVIAEWFKPKKDCYAIRGEKSKSIRTISVETVFEIACKALSPE